MTLDLPIRDNEEQPDTTDSHTETTQDEEVNQDIKDDEN